MGFLTRENDLYKQFFRLTVMIALQNAIGFSVSLIDNVMLGTYSEVALSGVTLANQVHALLAWVIGAVGEGVTILGARCWGRKRPDEIHPLMACSVYIGIVLMLVFTFVPFCFPEWTLRLFTDSDAILAEGVAYIRVVCFSYIPYSVTVLLVAVLRSIETVRIAFTASVVSLAVNVVSNYILIFGKFGFPELGVVGAAYATVLSRFVELSVVAVFVIFREKILRLNWRSFFRPTKEAFSLYIRVSWPMILSAFSWGVAMGTQASILGHLEDAAVAANSVASTLFSIVMVFGYGSSNATQVIIGKTVGAGQQDRLPAYTRTLQVLYCGVGVLTCGAIFLLKQPIIGLYDLSTEASTLANTFLTALALISVCTCYQNPCIGGIVRGGGRTNFNLINDFVFAWLIATPLAALAAFVWHLDPIWVFLFLKIEQPLKCFVAWYAVNRWKWLKQF